jgi:hypothetical protein
MTLDFSRKWFRDPVCPEMTNRRELSKGAAQSDDDD